MPTTSAKPRGTASASSRTSRTRTGGAPRTTTASAKSRSRARPVVQPGRRRARLGAVLVLVALVAVGVYALLALPHTGDVALFAMIGVIALAPTALTAMLLGISARRTARRHSTAVARFASAAIVGGALLTAVGTAALTTIIVVLVRIQTGTF